MRIAIVRLRKHRFDLVVLLFVVFWQYLTISRLKSKPCKTEYCPAGDTLPFPPPQHFRQHHRCNFETVPLVTDELSAAKLLLYANYSLVRFGDVDIELMQGITWPSQTASADLSLALLKALTDEVPNLMVGIYDTFSGQSRIRRGHDDFLHDNDQYRQFLLKHLRLDRQYFPTLISSPFVLNEGTHCINVEEVYDTLRKIWKDKDIVLLRGANKQEYEYDVYDTARSQKVIYAPPYQAWNSYKELKGQLMSENPNSLYILSAGPVAKVLTYDLVHSGRRALDLGHLAKDYNIFRGNRSVPSHFFLD